jgi:5-hydroxyisourate hydrolase-like protein (transthyretin family)
MAQKVVLALALLTGILFSAAGAEELAGKVMQDNSGTPVASADVRLYKIGVRGLAADLETDGEGRFEAVELTAGEYRMEIEKPNYLNATSTFRIDPGSSVRLNIRLVRRGTISGKVRSTTGHPISSAMVRAFTKTPFGLRPMILGQGSYSNLDESGGYRLYNLPPGEYAVAVCFGAFSSAVSSTGNVPPNTEIGSGFLFYPNNAQPDSFTIIGGEEFRNVDLTILTGATFHVSGKVELPAAKTLFWVTLTPVDQPSVAVAVTPVGEDGGFNLAGIPAGLYNLFAAGPVRGRSFSGASLDKEPLFARSRIEVSRDVSDVILTPQKGLSAAIRLAVELGSEGACPLGASVNLVGLEDWGAMLQLTARAARDKDTSISNLAPAKYQLSAAELGENCYQTAESILDLTAGSPGTIAIPVASAGSVHGIVSGATDADFLVILLPSRSSFDMQLVRSAKPGPDGRFSFAALAPGKYRIAAHRTAGSAQARWMGDGEHMVEIEVRSGKPTEVEIPAPQPANPQQ